MAKVIRYSFQTGEAGDKRFQEKSLTWSEANEEIARKEAYLGEYTLEEDGRQEKPADAEQVVNVLLGVTG